MSSKTQLKDSSMTHTSSRQTDFAPSSTAYSTPVTLPPATSSGGRDITQDNVNIFIIAGLAVTLLVVITSFVTFVTIVLLRRRKRATPAGKQTDAQDPRTSSERASRVQSYYTTTTLSSSTGSSWYYTVGSETERGDGEDLEYVTNDAYGYTDMFPITVRALPRLPVEETPTYEYID